MFVSYVNLCSVLVLSSSERICDCFIVKVKRNICLLLLSFVLFSYMLRSESSSTPSSMSCIDQYSYTLGNMYNYLIIIIKMYKYILQDKIG